jgi:hypothetical protein
LLARLCPERLERGRVLGDTFGHKPEFCEHCLDEHTEVTAGLDVLSLEGIEATVVENQMSLHPIQPLLDASHPALEGVEARGKLLADIGVHADTLTLGRRGVKRVLADTPRRLGRTASV